MIFQKKATKNTENLTNKTKWIRKKETKQQNVRKTLQQQKKKAKQRFDFIYLYWTSHSVWLCGVRMRYAYIYVCILHERY